MATTVILIRHGETDWSCQKRYCGFSDIDLNEKGRQQGRQLHGRLKQETINAVYASDLKRTLQFAGIVLKGVPIKETADLRELNFGIFEGLTHEDIMKVYPQIYGKWLENPLEGAIPQGEGLHAMAQRVRRALRTIVSANTDKTVAIVTHGGPIKVMVCDVLRLGLHEIRKIEQALASISIIEFVEERGTIQIQNDISHLHETALW